jgi:hypothetical protein
MLQQNDALGGAGSIFSKLQAIAVGGVSRAVDGVLAKKFPLTSFNENLTVTADGSVKPASAPAESKTQLDAAKEIFSNPIVIGVGISVAVTLILIVALRK